METKSIRRNGKNLLIGLLTVGLLASSATAVSLLYSLNVPAQLALDTPGLAAYQPDCTTPLTTLTFSPASPGSTASAELCLVPGGSASSEYLDSNSITNTLPSNDGSISYTITQKQGNNRLSPPIQLVPGNAGSTMFINFTLTSASTATSTPFTISISAYSG
jgi:hypothetical protein